MQPSQFLCSVLSAGTGGNKSHQSLKNKTLGLDVRPACLDLSSISAFAIDVQKPVLVILKVGGSSLSCKILKICHILTLIVDIEKTLHTLENSHQLILPAKVQKI